MAGNKSANKMSKPVFTPVFRISFPHVLEAEMKKADDGTEYQVWSCAALFPKTAEGISTNVPKYLRDELVAAMSGEKYLPTLRAAANEAINEAWPDPNNRPRKLHSPFRDADSGETCDDGVPPGEKWDGYAGTIFVSLTSNRKPGVVDQTPKAIINPDEVYGGGWFRAQVAACTYSTKKVGVRFILLNLQKVADDTPFGSVAANPESVFGAVGGGATPAASNAADDMI